MPNGVADITPDSPADAAYAENAGPTPLLDAGAVTDADNLTDLPAAP